MLRHLIPVVFLTLSSQSIANDFAWQKLVELTDHKVGIGARPAGSLKEQETARWIREEWQALDLEVNEFPFEFVYRSRSMASSNLSVTIEGRSKKTILIAAHFDSTGEHHGSLGTIDNGSGVAALLGLAKRLQGQSLPYTVRLVAFGAEEIGLQGSKAYVINKQESLSQVVSMINLDTIIGGDKLYVHSAHEEPYKCDFLPKPQYEFSTQVRDTLLQLAESQYGELAHGLHPAYAGYPEGQTGSWSDHAPFACSGVPIAYLEATNFDINGHSGNDGYSQSSHPKLWDCYDNKANSACKRESETKWGMIWHTQYDRLDKLEPLFKKRLKTQLKQNVDLLEAYVTQAKF